MKTARIIGLGLLGGSFGLSLRRQFPDIPVIGVDTSRSNAQKALELGIIDEIADPTDEYNDEELIILAIPVNAIANQIGQVLSKMKPNSLLIDLGSTKKLICQEADKSPNRQQFVATHPIAGTENSGPEAAFSELLCGKKIIICDSENSSPGSLEKTIWILKAIGMQIEYMSSQAHDLHIAFVSHLSHISSFSLGSAVLDTEKNEKNIFIMAGSGFSSTVRLAKSSPDMWAPIFDQNSENISRALGLYIEKLSTFKDYLDNHEVDNMHQFMKETNDIRRVLDGPEKKEEGI